MKDETKTVAFLNQFLVIFIPFKCMHLRWTIYIKPRDSGLVYKLM